MFGGALVTEGGQAIGRVRLATFGGFEKALVFSRIFGAQAIRPTAWPGSVVLFH